MLVQFSACAYLQHMVYMELEGFPAIRYVALLLEASRSSHAVVDSCICANTGFLHCIGRSFQRHWSTSS